MSQPTPPFSSPSPFANLGRRRRPLGAKKADTPAPEDDELDGDDDEAKEKARKARKAEDEQDERDEEDPDARAARARERSRVMAIVTCAAAKANPVAAVHLATSTSMSRTKAIAALAALTGAEEPAPSRAAAQPAGAQQRSMSATAQQIIAAGKKARGEI